MNTNNDTNLENLRNDTLDSVVVMFGAGSMTAIEAMARVDTAAANGADDAEVALVRDMITHYDD